MPLEAPAGAPVGAVLRRTVAKAPVTVFIALTLGFQLTIVLLAYALMPAGTELHDHPDAHMVFRFRVFGPLVFSVGLTWLLEGRNGLRRLFGAFLHWRVPVRWYALAFTWKFIVTYIGMAVLAFFAVRAWPGTIAPGFLPGLLRNMPFIVGIAIVEETAWMKFAVTRLNERHSAWRTSLIVGLCWGLWYLPMLLLGEGVPDGIPWPVFLFSMLSLTVLLSWAYNETHSGLVLLIMQILSNCAFIMVPVLPGWHHLDPAYVVAFVAVFFVAALAILWYAGPACRSSATAPSSWCPCCPAGTTSTPPTWWLSWPCSSSPPSPSCGTPDRWSSTARVPVRGGATPSER